jgi:hypothetical protein
MSLSRTMGLVAIVAALCLGSTASPAAAMPTQTTAAASSSPCATSALTASRTRVLKLLASEKSTLQVEQARYAEAIASDNLQLLLVAPGSEQRLSLRGKITILRARLSAAATSLSSVNLDVGSLGTCTARVIALVKKHDTWRKLVTQRSLVTAELSVATSDLAFRKAALVVEKRAKDTKAEKATKKLIAIDKSQIKLDRAELASLAKKLNAL